MSVATRSRVMSRIRGKDTGPELVLAAVLAEHGFTWESHARDLPGRPDFVFREIKLAIFVDGDFWHGWRFADWRHKLSEKWELKIAGNRRRDSRNRRLLRVQGWTVLRLWEHEVDRNPKACLRKITKIIDAHKVNSIDQAAPGRVSGCPSGPSISSAVVEEAATALAPPEHRSSVG